MHLGDFNLQSEVIEKMNHTIKKTLAKICQEMHLKWDQALTIALLQIRVAP